MNSSKVRRNFWLVFFVTLTAFLVDLPPSFPLKLDYKDFHFEKIITRPDFIKRNLDLKLGLDLAGGASLTFEADFANIDQENVKTSLEALKANIEKRINFFGVSETSVRTSKQADKYRLLVELPGLIDANQAIALLGQTAQLDFRKEVEIPPEATLSATILDVFPESSGLNGSHLTRSAVQFDPNTGQPQVSLEFNAEGADLFEKLTEESVGQSIAIFLDQFPVSAPTVNEKISGGMAVISGNFSLEEAKALVAQLNAGALPVPLTLVEHRTIGPTLGQESIQRGIKAGLLGITVVIFFMILNYGVLGLIASLGLLVYSIITLALYKLIPVTLTFPGITGFLLSVGMAVDSNILIFERMKEEIQSGKDRVMAMELGFGRAWDSIRDANVCTLITGFILFNPFDWPFLNSSGMIRGFAVTLVLGIFISLFTGIVVTRTFLRLLIKPQKKL
jgi:preprotein translocase subunit SecD